MSISAGARAWRSARRQRKLEMRQLKLEEYAEKYAATKKLPYESTTPPSGGHP